MRLGVTVFLTDLSINPVRLAREVEARGFHSMYFPEHTHIPVARETPHPVEGTDRRAGRAQAVRPHRRVRRRVDADRLVRVQGGAAAVARGVRRRRSGPDSAEAVPFGVLPSPGKLEYLESLGVREAVLALPKGGADEVLPALDAYAAQFGSYLTPG